MLLFHFPLLPITHQEILLMSRRTLDPSSHALRSSSLGCSDTGISHPWSIGCIVLVSVLCTPLVFSKIGWCPGYKLEASLPIRLIPFCHFCHSFCRMVYPAYNGSKWIVYFMNFGMCLTFPGAMLLGYMYSFNLSSINRP